MSGAARSRTGSPWRPSRAGTRARRSREQLVDARSKRVGADRTGLVEDPAVGGDEQGDGVGDDLERPAEVLTRVPQQLVGDVPIAGEAGHRPRRVEGVDADETDLVTDLTVDRGEVGQLLRARRARGEPEVD